MRKILKVALVLAPLLWVGLLSWASPLLPLHKQYSSLWYEHREMMANSQPRSASGESLADIFDEVSRAQAAYLDVLEGVLALGVLPAFVIYFSVALRQALRTPAQPIKAESRGVDRRSNIRLLAKRLFMAVSVLAWAMMLFTLSVAIVSLDPDDSAQSALAFILVFEFVAKVFIAWAIVGLLFVFSMFMTSSRDAQPDDDDDGAERRPSSG